MNLFKNKDKNKKTKFLKTQKLLHYCLTAVLPFCLAGCMGVYEGGFECPPGEGVGCKSISEVNEMVNQGLGTRKQGLNTQPSEETQESVCRKGHACPSAPDSLEIWYAPRGPWKEPLRDESLRDAPLRGKSSRNKALLEV
ncbi:MAG: hypothetical protein JSR85_03390 [Proteobacteria bacterium]|nr:hypothetical protein [Pseudomonadota bacterium]